LIFISRKSYQSKKEFSNIIKYAWKFRRKCKDDNYKKVGKSLKVKKNL